MEFQIYCAAFATLVLCCLLIAYVWHVLDSIVRAADALERIADAIDADAEDEEEDDAEGE